MVENLDRNIPEGLNKPVTVRYADVDSRVGADSRVGVDSRVGAAAPGAGRGTTMGHNSGPRPAPPPPPRGQHSGTTSSQASDNLYIKGLPPHMTEDKLRDIFTPYGDVTSTKVLQSNGKSVDGQGESVALLQFGTEEEARWIEENLNGNIPEGLERPISVKFYTKGGGKGTRK